MAEEDQPVIDLGKENSDEPAIPLEEKYREQMRQIVSQKIELPISTLPIMIKEQINLSPDFQRRGIWDRERQSRFIESIIMNVPVPAVFLGEDEYGKYVVLDGRQRLTAVYEYLQNVYALKGLEVWNDFNNLTYHQLEQRKLSSAITRRFIPAVVLLRESSAQVKYDVFDRLNTGGITAVPMEIRNAIYRGEFTTLLHELASSRIFRQIWGIPLNEEKRLADATYRRMDDLELILRFFALREPELMDMNFRDYLSEFMQKRNKLYETKKEKIEEDRAAFLLAVENVWSVFGESAFLKPLANGQFSKVKSAPLADAITLALAEVPNAALTSPAKAKIKAAVKYLCLQIEEFRKAIGTGTNGKAAISNRIMLCREAFKIALEG